MHLVSLATVSHLFIKVRFFLFVYNVDNNGQLNKSSPDSGYPGDGLNGDLNNGFYENLPFHGMKQQTQQPHKQVSKSAKHDKPLSRHLLFYDFVALSA